MPSERLVLLLILAAVLGVDVFSLAGGVPKDEAIQVSRAASEWRAENEERLSRLGDLEREVAALRSQNTILLRLLDGATLAEGTEP